jgi:Zn-dependent protease with chaperone function
MFVARGAIVCLAFFVLMYSTLSFLVASGWWMVQRGRSNPLGSAGLLFGLRIFPFTISSLVAIFFTFPSFWLMERKSLDEDATTFFLAGCALLVLLAGIARVLRAKDRTSRAVNHWLRNPGFASESNSAALSAAKGAPALMLVGVCRPTIMVSDMAAAVLSESELQVAIRHELGHQRSWDNLKKLLINATAFPGMKKVEMAWREAAELAADDAAVASRQDALDLASALIKISRSAKQWVEPELASGLVCGSSAVTLRVQRLLEWRAAGHRISRAWPWVLLLAFVVGGIASNYGSALVLTHRVTELLVP